MAAPSSTVWGPIITGSSSGRKGKLGIYTSVSNTDTQTTVNVQVWFWTIYSCTDHGNTLYYNIGTNVSSATTSQGSVSVLHSVESGSGWSTSNQTRILNKTHTYTRQEGYDLTYKIYARLSNIDILGKDAAVSTTVKVPRRASYTITYNANGGSGAPASQTKYHGTTLVLSSTTPTRSGYTFKGWALTKADADAGTWYYQPGGSCGKNENLTLYAVWEAGSYTVTYNANGGSGAPASQAKTHGVNLTLSTTKPTRTNYTFKGWGISASTTVVSYDPGAIYSDNKNLTLYAIWELSYVKPRIAELSVNRCLQDGTASDDGTYAQVKFNWECSATISSITIEWTDSSGTSNSTSVIASGTSGSVNTIVGSGSLNTEKLYTFEIIVQDTVSYSPASATLNGTKFVMDFLAGGNGVAFGKAAERNDYADFGFNAIFNGSVRGNAFGLGTLNQLSTGDDLNTFLTPGVWGIGSHATGGSLKNSPAGSNAGRLIVCSATGGGYGIGDWTYIQQWYIPMSFASNTNTAIYVRTITREPNKSPNYYSWYKFTATAV